MRIWACYPWDLERIEESRSGGWAGFNEIKRAQEGHNKSYRTPTASKCFYSPSFHFPWWPLMPLETRTWGRFFSKKKKKEHPQLPDLPVNRSLCKEGCFCLRIQSYVLGVASSYPCFEWAVKASRLFEKALIYAALQKQRSTQSSGCQMPFKSTVYLTTRGTAGICQEEDISSALEPEAQTQTSFVPSNQPVQSFRPVCPLHCFMSFPRIQATPFQRGEEQS